MRLQGRLEDPIRAAAARPRATIAIVALLAIAGALIALTLRPSADTSTFVSASSPAFRATADDAAHFGSDTIAILVRERLTNLVETKDLGVLTELEACLAGQTVIADPTFGSFRPGPASRPAYGGAGSPCGWLKRHNPAKVVYGPGTFLSRAVTAVNQQVRGLLAGVRRNIATRESQAYQLAVGEGLSQAAARRAASAAGQLASAQATQQLETLYLNSGIKGAPRIDDPQFIPQVVFDPTRGTGVPKARFAYLFPGPGSALIQVRLRAGLDGDMQAQAIREIRAAVGMPRFHLAYGGTYTVGGAPVVVSDLAAAITDSIVLLLAVAVAVMGVALLLVVRVRPRLLPLFVALAAAGITFGVWGLAGATLTIASIAVLPILIGLAVDYTIQFAARGALSVRTLATAALATACGFLALLLSPVPMVRGFGLLLVLGVLVALACALVLVPAVAALESPGGPLAAAWRGAGEIVREVFPRRRMHSTAGGRGAGSGPPRRRARGGGQGRGAFVSRFGGVAMALPGRVLAVGVVVAVVGFALDTGAPVQTDVTKLVPSDLPALRSLRALESTTGVSGQVDVLVRGRDVTDPAVVGWMTGYESRLLSHYGYLETLGCARSTLCPALSLPDLFSTGTGGGTGTQGNLTGAQIRGLLSSVPSYFSQAVITADRREATLAFGIRLMPLARQQHVLDYMRSQLHPPDGVSATLTGLPVLAAQANADLASAGHRLLLTLLGLLAVGGALLLVLRDRRRALVPLVPIILATGWSGLVLRLVGIPLNPMSATLGTLVIAISTEFSVLLSERFRHERAAGAGEDEALAVTYATTGRAVLASGATAIAGFAVLLSSSITMLRDFAAVTVIDLTVSLAGVVFVLPAALGAVERRRVAGRVAGTGAPLRVRRRAGVAES